MAKLTLVGRVTTAGALVARGRALLLLPRAEEEAGGRSDGTVFFMVVCVGPEARMTCPVPVSSCGCRVQEGLVFVGAQGVRKGKIGRPAA